ncbi:MAG: PHP domain-containing protein [Fimbriimonadaceae bacterium]|nr:PHP domain-containing protein [Fimbriimonadaceae bacterium]
MIDLHTHTTCSDGTDRPAELLAAAAAAGLRAVAITDHDTVAAYQQVAPGGSAPELIAGVEMSCDLEPAMLDVLGYHVEPQHPVLQTTLRALHDWREERNVQIGARLQALGLPADYAAARALAGDGELGRPHFARVLLQRGAVESISEAFDRWLGSGKPAYLPKSRLTIGEAIDSIHAAGGAAVVAHPCFLRLADTALARQLREWRSLGLDGLEVHYPEHTARQRQLYAELATALGLLITVGSDYHGSIKPQITLGGLYPPLPADEAVLDPLRAAAERWR